MSPMPDWLVAEEAAAIFAVAPSTLELYSVRGALPSFLDEDGRRRFDPGAVAAIFRRRGVPVAAVAARSLGVLGALTLGEAPSSGRLPTSTAALRPTSRV
jgi:hypothetical protein